jgi:hypothetical protein
MFPEWFPEECPPEGAQGASATVFRIVSGSTPLDADFLTHHELGTALTAPPCKRCAISVFDSFENALHRLRLSPRLGNAVAQGQLETTSGKIDTARPRSGHISWWAYGNVVRHELFGDVQQCT